VSAVTCVAGGIRAVGSVGREIGRQSCSCRRPDCQRAANVHQAGSPSACLPSRPDAAHNYHIITNISIIINNNQHQELSNHRLATPRHAHDHNHIVLTYGLFRVRYN